MPSQRITPGTSTLVIRLVDHELSDDGDGGDGGGDVGDHGGGHGRVSQLVSHVESIFGGDRGDHGGNCEGDENPSDDNDIFIRDVGREDGGMYQCIAGESR